MKKPSVLPAGVRLDGEVEGEGDLIVLGHVEGPIRVDGALVIEEGGVVRGHVHARLVTVRGALKGDAFADEGIRVEATGRLVGDLTAPRVRVIPGAQFSGQVHVRALEVAPPLRSYDPAMHTFTGLPAPGPISDDLARGVSIVGAAAPLLDAADTLSDEAPVPPRASDTLAEDVPPSPLRERPSAERVLRSKAVPPVELPDDGYDERPTDHRALAGAHPPAPAKPKFERVDDLALARPAPRPPKGGRMPRLGKVRGAHRTPR